jgi:predicted P-loop ATPase
MSAAGDPSIIPLEEAKRRRAPEGGGPSAPSGSWRDALLKNGKGEVKPLLANAMTSLRLSPDWHNRLRFDIFHNRAEVDGRAPWSAGDSNSTQEWSNQHDVLLAEWLQHQGIYVGSEIAAQAVDVVAREHIVHPVREYIAKCTWDATPRLDGMLEKYFGAEPSDYAKAVGSKWAISAVARIDQPGCKADCAIVFEGTQGKRKSTAIKAMSEPWYSDQISEFGSKDAAIEVQGVWVIELAELEAIKAVEVAKIKAFMSRSNDRFRPPYGRRVSDVPRQCVFAGTTNSNQYLRDETGGRRFWPIACIGRIDVEGLHAVRDQLWAEARDRYLSGETWWFETAPLLATARHEQQGRYKTDPWEESIATLAAASERLSIAEVLTHLNIPLKERDQRDANRVAHALRALEWERRQGYENGKKKWYYWPPSPVSPDEAT